MRGRVKAAFHISIDLIFSNSKNPRGEISLQLADITTHIMKSKYLRQRSNNARIWTFYRGCDYDPPHGRSVVDLGVRSRDATTQYRCRRVTLFKGEPEQWLSFSQEKHFV